MRYWLKLIVGLAIVGVVKAHGKLIVLAILGLIGLWLTHLLAQDYQNISKPAAIIKRLLGKRSIESQNEHFSEINWDMILSNDPTDCVKSFLCQISADSKNLNGIETSILELARNSGETRIKKCVADGKNVENCMKTYFLCPYSKITMAKLVSRCHLRMNHICALDANFCRPKIEVARTI